MMCLAHVNDNHFIMVYLTDDYLIPPTSILYGQHYQDDAKSWDYRYVHMMIAYKELSRATGNEIVGDNDVAMLKTLITERRLLVIRKLEMESRLKKMALDLMIVAYTLVQIS